MKILWVNPPDLEGPTDEEPGYTAVTEDPLLSLTWDTSTPFAVGGSVGTFAWQHCLMLSVCVCVSFHVRDTWVKHWPACCSHTVEAASQISISTAHKKPLQTQTHLAENINWKHGPFLPSWVNEQHEEMLCCALIPYSSQARLCLLGRDKVLH